jgi:hypothetical protein
LIEGIRKVAGKLVSNVETTSGSRRLFNFGKSCKEISSNNFVVFEPVEGADSKIAFVDGGNLEILSGPNLCVQYNRLYLSIFKNTERIRPKTITSKIEFFSTVSLGFEKDVLHYYTQIAPLDEKFTEFLPKEKNLTFSYKEAAKLCGKERPLPSDISSIVREFSELVFAKHISEKELTSGDMLVRDGNLDIPHGECHMHKIQKIAIDRGIVLIGLSKTCSLLTTTAGSIIAAIGDIATEHNLDKKCWYCENIADESSYPVDLTFVKLNPSSKYIFRLDMLWEQSRRLKREEKNHIMGVIANEAKGKALPGYPYGLIDADKNARVRKHEREAIQMLLISEISRLGKLKEFERLINAINTHEKLNIIVGD